MVGGIASLRSVVPAIRHHHERWDGRGYPDGLAGEAIPLFARIIAVADSFDAMITTRPYRREKSVAAALAEIIACAGAQFDPAMARLFCDYMSGGETSSRPA
jgi:HD-GYP domain-containing protein (c-di-GMP phosphodiesterase class II)